MNTVVTLPLSDSPQLHETPPCWLVSYPRLPPCMPGQYICKCEQHDTLGVRATAAAAAWTRCMSAVTFCFSSKDAFSSFNRAIAASTAACNTQLCYKIYTRAYSKTIAQQQQPF